MDGGGGTPAFTAAELRTLYLERGAEIFPPLRPHWRRAGRGIFDERYRQDALEEVLEDYMKDARLKDALAPVLVPAYEIELRQPFFFRSVRASEDPGPYDFSVRDAARATSAAPTYFEAARVASNDTSDPFALVDGGVFANNPAMCAFADVRLRRHEQATPGEEAEAKASPLPPSEMMMVSLGTGELNRRLPWTEAKDWGFYGWGRQLLGIVMDGVSDAAAFQCRQLLGDRYHRFQTELQAGTDALDDASETNLEALDERAKELVATSADDIDKVCELLT